MSKKKTLSFNQFIKRFPDEKACAEYLYQIKWPNGFECPVCGHRHCYPIKGYRRYQCAKCHHQTSLTANTVMHRSHLPLKKWFWAMYLVACDKRGISALALAEKIEVCYETAWNVLRRIRTAMETRDAHYTVGQIVDSTMPTLVRKSRVFAVVGREIRAFSLQFKKMKMDARRI